MYGTSLLEQCRIDEVETGGTDKKSESRGQASLDMTEPTQYAPKVPTQLVPPVPPVLLNPFIETIMIPVDRAGLRFIKNWAKRIGCLQIRLYD